MHDDNIQREQLMHAAPGSIAKPTNRDIKMTRWASLLWTSRGWNSRVFKPLTILYIALLNLIIIKALSICHLHSTYNKFYTNFMLASTVVHVQWLVSNSTQQHCIIETHDKAVIYRTWIFFSYGLKTCRKSTDKFLWTGCIFPQATSCIVCKQQQYIKVLKVLKDS